MRLPFPDLRRRADQWTSRNLFWIALGGFVVTCFLFGMVNYYGDQAEQVVATRPILPRKQIKQIQARAQADSVKATVYKKVAVEAIKQADSARTEARKSVAIADSLKAQYDALPSVSDSPLSAVQSRLANYTSPDTAAL